MARTGIASFAHLGTSPITDETVAYMKAHDVASITTLVVHETFTPSAARPARLSRSADARDRIPKIYRRELTQFANRRLTAADSAADRAAIGRLKTAMANAKRLFDAGFSSRPARRSVSGGLFRRRTPSRARALGRGGAHADAGDRSRHQERRTADARRVHLGNDRGRQSERTCCLCGGTRRNEIGDTKNVTSVIHRGRVVDLRRLAGAIAAGPDFHPAGSTAK